jgi:hypothetical protein
MVRASMLISSRPSPVRHSGVLPLTQGLTVCSEPRRLTLLRVDRIWLAKPQGRLMTGNSATSRTEATRRSPAAGFCQSEDA